MLDRSFEMSNVELRKNEEDIDESWKYREHVS
jgi:hypothetical protein